MQTHNKGFTLAELLVSISITTILVLLASRLVSSAATITSLGQKRMDADSQARQLFARMASDFAQMIKRSDVDAYLKGLDQEPGNDKIAFFSHVPGYYPSRSSQSPISLVAYRVNSDPNSAPYTRMERMAKGLLWNGASNSNKPLIFGGSPTLQTNWATATDSATADPDYEVIGPQVFRFEYFYLLTDGTLGAAPTANGMQSIAAISVCIAIVDSKSEILLTNPQLSALAGRLADFSTSMSRTDLLTGWQDTLNNVTDMPRPAISAIKLYERDFYLQ